MGNWFHRCLRAQWSRVETKIMWERKRSKAEGERVKGRMSCHRKEIRNWALLYYGEGRGCDRWAEIKDTHIKMQSQNGGILLNSEQSEKQMSNVTGMMRWLACTGRRRRHIKKGGKKSKKCYISPRLCNQINRWCHVVEWNPIALGLGWQGWDW